jgi:hypothetical protein
MEELGGSRIIWKVDVDLKKSCSDPFKIHRSWTSVERRPEPVSSSYSSMEWSERIPLDIQVVSDLTGKNRAK